MPTHAEPAHASKNKSPDSSVLQQRNRNHSTLQVEDNRPEAVMQGKLQAMVGASPQVLQLRAFQPMANSATSKQQCPIQRQSGKSGEIAAAMGQQYGVDTSPLKFTHNSSFPATVGATATIQGSDIHFAPGQDNTTNIKHEVGHFIDNSINGTPKGNLQVNGHNVDTTRESVADKLASKPLQLKCAGYKIDNRLGRKTDVIGANGVDMASSPIAEQVVDSKSKSELTLTTNTPIQCAGRIGGAHKAVAVSQWKAKKDTSFNANLRYLQEVNNAMVALKPFLECRTKEDIQSKLHSNTVAQIAKTLVSGVAGLGAGFVGGAVAGPAVSMAAGGGAAVAANQGMEAAGFKVSKVPSPDNLRRVQAEDEKTTMQIVKEMNPMTMAVNFGIGQAANHEALSHHWRYADISGHLEHGFRHAGHAHPYGTVASGAFSILYQYAQEYNLEGVLLQVIDVMNLLNSMRETTVEKINAVTSHVEDDKVSYKLVAQQIHEDCRNNLGTYEEKVKQFERYWVHEIEQLGLLENYTMEHGWL